MGLGSGLTQRHILEAIRVFKTHEKVTCLYPDHLNELTYTMLSGNNITIKTIQARLGCRNQTC